MPTFFEELQRLPGKHRTNIPALLILKLSHYTAKTPEDNFLIQSLLPALKTYFYNHEQRFGVYAFLLKQHLQAHETISAPLMRFLTDVIHDLKQSKVHAYFSKDILASADLDCSIQRQLESNIAINLLLNPSKLMWESVKNVSETLITLIKSQPSDIDFHPFLDDLGPSTPTSTLPNLALAFGRYPHKPTLKEIIDSLEEHTDLARIMLIHFMFMRNTYPDWKLTMYPTDLDTYAGDFRSFYLDPTHKDKRRFFSEYPTYAPHLYTDRGRGPFHARPSRHLGITLPSKERDQAPTRKEAWLPDSLCQEAKLSSPYVRFSLTHDIPYVAGPSGMTSIFCGCLLFLGRWSQPIDRHYYLLSVLAFMISGGLHNMHEVLTVPHVRLGLCPDYKTDGAEAGNYDAFFSLFHDDKQVSSHLNTAWLKTLEALSTTYPELTKIQEAVRLPKAIKRTCSIQ